MSSSTAPSRLPAEQRRDHLLDVAAALVVEQGTALTMEAIASRAGVSKALGYAYFPNVDALLAELHGREERAYFRAVREAVEPHETFDRQLSALVACSFATVARSGVLQQRLAAHLASTGQSERRPDPFLAGLVRTAYGCDDRASRAGARLVASVVDASVRNWVGGLVGRRNAESQCCAFALAGLAAMFGPPRGAVD